MPDNDELDPGAPTEVFQAFFDRAEPDEPQSGWKWVAVAVAVALVVLLAWLVFVV